MCTHAHNEHLHHPYDGSKSISETANMADHPTRLHHNHHCENFQSDVSLGYTALYKLKKIYKDVSVMETQTITMKTYLT